MAFCENCMEIADVEEQFKEKEKVERLQQAHQAAVQLGTQTEEDLARQRRDKSDRMYIWMGVGAASMMLFGSLGLYAFPNVFNTDPERAAIQIAAQALEDCRLVFEEIGYLLEKGNPLDFNLQCENTAVPNQVSQSGEVITVSHPNPMMYGLSALYVSSESHKVVIEE